MSLAEPWLKEKNTPPQIIVWHLNSALECKPITCSEKCHSSKNGQLLRSDVSIFCCSLNSSSLKEEFLSYQMFLTPQAHSHWHTGELYQLGSMQYTLCLPVELRASVTSLLLASDSLSTCGWALPFYLDTSLQCLRLNTIRICNCNDLCSHEWMFTFGFTS